MANEVSSSTSRVQGHEGSSFVEVMFAKSPDEAAGCRDLLEQQNIPARVEGETEVSRRSGIAVLVPSNWLIQASELLANRAQY